MRCGDCPSCLGETHELLRLAPTTTPARRREPTAAELERHAKRFGADGVHEAAAELGVDVTVERPKKDKVRRRGPSLKARVAGYVADGRSVEWIAEAENLTPGRARRLVAEVSA